MSGKISTRRWLFLLFLVMVESVLIWRLYHREQIISAADWLNAYSAETDSFRAMDFGEGMLERIFLAAEDWDEESYKLLAVMLCSKESGIQVNEELDNRETDGWELPEYRQYRRLANELSAQKPVEWMKLVNAYRTVLADVCYFPVAIYGDDLSGLSYENGWGDKRTYGGERKHEGTDIFDNANIRGSYPIVSISDGVIEHIGWLEQGGYRIGIRSPHGAYFYYAHLAAYAEDFSVGQHISAGQLIGFMGDTGYSAMEGTTGNFPVHLHLGIYLETDHFDELSVNPYYILKYLENFIVSYTKETFLWYNLSDMAKGVSR